MTHPNIPLGDLLARRVNVVYYVQFGERVKIGTTANFPSRMRDVPHDAVLALEPGNHALEHLRHLEYAELRVNGEWFTMGERLLAHIRQVVAIHGDPRSALIRWITSDTPYLTTG